jgi:FkbM family methyltransferase
MAQLAPPRNHGTKYIALNQLAKITRRVHPKGTDRVLRALYNPDTRAGDHFEVVMPYQDALRISCDTASALEWNIFFFGQYEPDVAGLIRQYCRPGGVAIDIGANIGCHTLTMASAVGVSGRVVAIEPHPRVFARLARNIELNHLRNVEAHNVALGDTEGETTLYAPVESDPQPSMATLHLENLALDRAQHEAFHVRVVTLDAFRGVHGVERVDFIKIDVEGHELRVLEGARETIASCRPRIVFEFNREWSRHAAYTFVDVRAFFDAFGYGLSEVTRGGGLRRLGREETPGSGDIFASPPAG